MLVVVNMSRALKESYTYATWTDVVSLFQLSTLAAVLLETMWVNILLRVGKVELCVAIDEVMRFCERPEKSNRCSH